MGAGAGGQSLPGTGGQRGGEGVDLQCCVAAGHKALGVDEFVAALDPQQAAIEPAPAAVVPVWDWAAANQRKKEAVRQLAPLAHAVDEIETRIADLVARTRDLELG